MVATRNIAMVIGILVLSFLGGIAGQWLFPKPPVIKWMSPPVVGQVAGQPQATVDAQTFRVVDANGHVSALLGPTGLWLYDGQGQTRAYITTGVTYSSMGLYDPNYVARLSLSATAGGTSSLSLHDAAGNTRASMSASDSVTELGLSDHDGDIRALLKVDNQTLLQLADDPRINLFNAIGRAVWTAPNY